MAHDPLTQVMFSRTPSLNAIARHVSPTFFNPRLVEETDDLAGDVLPTGLLVVHDASGGGQDDVAELTRGQQPNGPLLEVGQLDVVAGRDDTGLVETVEGVSGDARSGSRCLLYVPAVELDNDLAGAVVVDLLELANVAWRQDSQ